jgi:hypothetical protein
VSRVSLRRGAAFLALSALVCCGGARVRPDAGVNGAASEAVAAQSPTPLADRAGGCSGVKTLNFSGYEWRVKCSDERVGPGPNYFSDGADNVEVDGQGRLHLRLTQRGGRWYCAEVVSARSFGYGTYRFYVDTPAADLSPWLVLGLFTWSDEPADHHREIDVEVSRWGKEEDDDAQFVVQPYTDARNVVRFRMPAGLRAATHSFTWGPGSVFCQSLEGHNAEPGPGSVIRQHTFSRGIPRAGGENARMNLWLFTGRPPDGLSETEAVISKFEFVPAP